MWSGIYQEKDFSQNNYAETHAGRIVANLFLSSRKVLYEIKESDQQLNCNIL